MEESAPIRLRKERRQERIVADLAAMPALRVSELAAALDVSTETIRRDFDELEARGLINRTYGGAIRHDGPEPAIAERHRMLVAEREAMAVEAARFVEHGATLMIGGGATTTHFARRLAAEKRNLVILTQAFGIATVLAANPTFRVQVCPGLYNPREGLMSGAETIEYLARFRADHAVLGSSGLTAEGPSEVDADDAAVYRAMASRSTATMILADHTKFERPALSLYFPWREGVRLVTDARPDLHLRRALEKARVEVILAKPRRV